MATQNLPLTETPQDVVAALSLAVGQTYSGQFRGLGEMYFAELAAAPGDDDVPGAVVDKQSIAIVPVAGESVWVWLDKSSTTSPGFLVVNEVS